MKKNKLLTIYCLLAMAGLVTASFAANETVTPKYIYKKSLGTLSVKQAPTDPVWDLSTDTLNFGELAAGQENTLTIGIQNTGLVVITSPSISTLGVGFSALHNCNSIAVGQSCIVNVTGNGQSQGANLSGNLTVTVAGVSKNVSLIGTSSFYDLSVEPGNIDFGNVFINKSSSKSFNIVNTGNKPVTVPNLVSSDSRISLSHSCGILAPQQSCIVTATLLGTTASPVVANSTVATAGISKTVNFEASLVQASATLAPSTNSSFDFGLQDINQARTQNYLFTNTSPLDITGLSVTPPSSTTVVGNNCGQTLSAGASCTFGVTWAPSTYSNLTGNLVVASSEVTKSAALTGSVKQSTAALQSGSLVLGSVSQYASSSTVLTFKNTGTANMTLTGLSGLPAAMSISNNTCSNIASSANCAMTVVLNTDNPATQGTTSVSPVGATNVTPISLSYTITAANASCLTIKTANPSLPSGTYTIDPDGAGGNAPVSVYCDMTTDGGGWTRVNSTDEALKAGTLSTISVSDMGLSYTSVLLVAKSNMFTKYANENSIWWSTGINPAIHGLKFGSSWYFLANPTAWRGYGGLNGSPYTVTLSGGVNWPNSNYTTVVANPGGSYCNLSGVAQTFCGRAVKVAVPSGQKLTGFNDLESLYPSTADNQSVRALDIYVK